MDRKRWLGAVLAGGWLAAFGGERPADGWIEHKSAHFVVRHRAAPGVAAEVARQAEVYYTSLAELLGLSRRGGFWLWDNRVTITVYPTREEFLQASGAPAWAGGKTDAVGREISGFHPGGDLLERLLPHEMAHMVFRDALKSAAAVPRWLEEGIAEHVAGRGRESAAGAAWIPLGRLSAMNVAAESDPVVVALYYRQSANLVGYLVEAHGSAAFQRLCRALRTAASFDDALRRAYGPALRDVEGLEAAWRAQVEKGVRP